MKVLHLLASGSFGGIETLIRDYSFKSKLNNVFVFVWDKGPIYDDMEKHELSCLYIGEKRGHFIHTVRHILEICKQEEPNVLVAHHGAPQFKVIISLLRVFYPSVKTVAYAHADAADIAKNGNAIKSLINKKMHQIGYKSANKIIAISEFVKQSIINEFSISSEKIEVVYNGVDISKFQTGKKLHDGTHIVFVGRLVEGKGVQVIIEALSNLEVDYHFDIVGDGDYRETLEKQVQELGLQERVTFWGARSDVGRFLDNADIFVHVPLLEEGFGITIVEAMASGLTCVCSRSGGIPELIDNEVTGYLVEKNSIKELSNVLNDIIVNYESKKNTMIRNNAKESAKKYSIQKYTSSLDSMLESAGGGITQLIYVGRLIPEKGVQTIIKAMFLLPEQYHLLIVGDGPFREELERMASDMNNRIVFCGSRSDIPRLLHFADIFVHMPEWEEGFGITVVEAMAAGKVCVVGNRGAMPEIITNGIDGIIVENDANDLAEKLLSLSNINMKLIGDNAEKRAEVFSIHTYCKNLEHVLLH